MYNIRIANIDGRTVDILSPDEYSQKSKMYMENPSMHSTIALEVDYNGTDYVLPFRNRTDPRPGIYNEGLMYFVNVPDTPESEQYKSSNTEIVDFNSKQTVKEFLNKYDQVRKMENTSLTDVDSVFIPTIGPNDSPVMKAFKEAVIDKHIDINKYADRFKDNYLNDKRIFKTDAITLNKLISISENLDIEVAMILRNKSEDVPNPMSKEISVVLTKPAEDE